MNSVIARSKATKQSQSKADVVAMRRLPRLRLAMTVGGEARNDNRGRGSQ